MREKGDTLSVEKDGKLKNVFIVVHQLFIHNQLTKLA